MTPLEVQFDIEGILQGQECKVPTRYGPVTVHVCGDTSKTPCVTYHDVGLNHKTCFTSLLVCSANTPLLLQNLCFYHIDAPGSEEGGEAVPEEILPFTMEKLTDQVEDILQHFHLEKVLGMGVGAGGYVLTSHAIKYPKRLFGLILLSPAISRPSWWEWSFSYGALLALKHPRTRYLAVDLIVQRLISGRSSELAHTIRTAVSNVSTDGLYHYLSAVLSREDLTECLSNLQVVRTLIMWGYNALYKNDSQEFNRAYKAKDRIGWAEVDQCGNLLTEECPFRVLDELKTYFQGLQLYGYCFDFAGLNC